MGVPLKIILFAIFLSSSSINSFCECKIYPFSKEKSQEELKLEDSLEYADLIFHGRYLGDKKFKALKIYRGETLLSPNKVIEESYQVSNCDYYFEIDQDYMVFGKMQENEQFLTSVCLTNL